MIRKSITFQAAMKIRIEIEEATLGEVTAASLTELDAETYLPYTTKMSR